MTSIDRATFIRDLSHQRISVGGNNPSPALQALEEAGVPRTELDRIAGSDHVISGEVEYGQLYDRLVALEAEAAQSGRREGNFDRAQVVYDALRTQRTTEQTPAQTSLSFGSARSRTTGIFGTNPLLPSRQEPLLSDSDHVRTLGRSAAARLDQAVRRNTTGSEASLQRRIQALTDHTARTIEGLERRRDALPANSRARAEINAQIRAEVRHFEAAIASELASLGRPTNAGNASDPAQGVVERLPPYLRDAADRGGVVIPGVPGAIAPRTGSTYGADWKLKF